MRGTVAKRIKREELIKLEGTEIPKETRYLVKNHVKINRENKKIIRRTFKLADCLRATYQTVKKQYKST